MPITQKIIELARVDPERVALSEGDKEVTYSELATGAGLYQAALAAAGKAEGEQLRIAVSLKRALDTARIVATLAGFNAVTLVLDPMWPEEHRLNAVESGQIQLVVTDDPGFKKALAVKSILSVGANELFGVAAGINDAGPQIRPGHEPFLLIFTSGTTDLPKGFYRTRDSWRYNALVSKKYLFAHEGLKTIAPGPISYSLTLYALIEVLATGGTLFLQSEFDAQKTAATIAGKSAERIVCVPAVLPALAAAEKRRPGSLLSLRYAVTGGAALSPAIRSTFEAAAPAATLLSYYGAAEIGFIGYSLGGEDPGDEALTPFAGVELSVRGSDGNELPAGETGSLYVRVASQADRYVTATNTATNTAGDAALVTGADGWATVHDQAYMIGRNFKLQGRAGDIANTREHKVSLLQIDDALERAIGGPAISLALPDEKLGSVIAAVIETQNAPVKQELLATLRELLPPQFVPTRFYYGEKLPRTMGGKLRRGETLEWLNEKRFERLT